MYWSMIARRISLTDVSNFCKSSSPKKTDILFLLILHESSTDILVDNNFKDGTLYSYEEFRPLQGQKNTPHNA